MSCVAPVSLPHYTTKPTGVGEFVFPEKSVFFTNISAIMKDPRFVPNPNVFDPDRFLNEEGRLESLIVIQNRPAVKNPLFTIQVCKAREIASVWNWTPLLHG